MNKIMSRYPRTSLQSGFVISKADISKYRLLATNIRLIHLQFLITLLFLLPQTTNAKEKIFWINLKIISDSRIHSVIAKGPKCRFPVQIDFHYVAKKLQHPLMNFVIIGVSENMLNVML